MRTWNSPAGERENIRTRVSRRELTALAVPHEDGIESVTCAKNLQLRSTWSIPDEYQLARRSSSIFRSHLKSSCGLDEQAEVLFPRDPADVK